MYKLHNEVFLTLLHAIDHCLHYYTMLLMLVLLLNDQGLIFLDLTSHNVIVASVGFLLELSSIFCDNYQNFEHIFERKKSEVFRNAGFSSKVDSDSRIKLEKLAGRGPDDFVTIQTKEFFSMEIL